jgi:hypothetical protein
METPETISVMDVTVRAGDFVHDSDHLVRGLASELAHHERLAIAPEAIDPMIAVLARIRAACSFDRITDEIRDSIVSHDAMGTHAIRLFDRIFYLRKTENASDAVKRLGEIQDRYWRMVEEMVARDGDQSSSSFGAGNGARCM